MYHGTSDSRASRIERGGSTPSTDGILGAGVHLSRDSTKASAYGQVVLETCVDVGRVKRIDSQGHPLRKRWADSGYDCAWVPPHCGMVGAGLEEDCVRDPRRIKVIRRARG